MFGVAVFLSVVILAGTRDINNSHYFQISVVSSSDNADLPAQFQAADTPLWDESTQSLFFVDLAAQKILRLDYVSGVIHHKRISSGPVRLLAFIRQSQRLVVSIRSTLYLLDPALQLDAGLRVLATLDPGHPDNVVQTAAADARGRLWVATRGPVAGQASLYSMSDTNYHGPRIHLRPIASGHGIVWARNDSFLYLLDGEREEILGFNFDLSRGELSGGRQVMNLSAFCEEDARPNHMAIDKNGYLWITMLNGGKILHINPATRALIYSYKVPALRVTSLCWGGPALDELFVTSAQSHEQLAGALFTIRGAGAGEPTHRMVFDNADQY